MLHFSFFYYILPIERVHAGLVYLERGDTCKVRELHEHIVDTVGPPNILMRARTTG